LVEDWFLDVPLEELLYVEDLIEGLIEELDSPWNNSDYLEQEVQKRFVKGIGGRFGSQLRECFKKAKITQADIARQLAVSPSAISQWYDGMGLSATNLIALPNLYPNVTAPMLREAAVARNRKEQRVSGYIAAMHWIGHEACKRKGCEHPLSEEEFWWIVHSQANEAWPAGNGRVGLRQIDGAVAAELGARPSLLTEAWLQERTKWLEDLTDWWEDSYWIAVYFVGMRRRSEGMQRTKP